MTKNNSLEMSNNSFTKMELHIKESFFEDKPVL